MHFFSKNIGRIGEAIAEKYLIKNKYQIIDKNFYLISKITNKKIGEIDLIAKKNKIYVFVEVKSTTKKNIKIPLEGKINKKKKKRMIIMGEAWLQKNKLPFTVPWQIDIITIVINLNDKKAQIKHYRNAIEDIKK